MSNKKKILDYGNARRSLAWLSIFSEKIDIPLYRHNFKRLYLWREKRTKKNDCIHSLFEWICLLRFNIFYIFVVKIYLLREDLHAYTA